MLNIIKLNLKEMKIERVESFVPCQILDEKLFENAVNVRLQKIYESNLLDSIKKLESNYEKAVKELGTMVVVSGNEEEGFSISREKATVEELEKFDELISDFSKKEYIKVLKQLLAELMGKVYECNNDYYNSLALRYSNVVEKSQEIRDGKRVVLNIIGGKDCFNTIQSYIEKYQGTCDWNAERTTDFSFIKKQLTDIISRVNCENEDGVTKRYVAKLSSKRVDQVIAWVQEMPKYKKGYLVSQGLKYRRFTQILYILMFNQDIQKKEVKTKKSQHIINI